MNPIQSAFLYRNFNIAVLDADGAQIRELQESPIILWAKHAEALGYDPTTVTIETPDGPNLRLFRTPEGGFNFYIA